MSKLRRILVNLSNGDFEHNADWSPVSQATQAIERLILQARVAELEKLPRYGKTRNMDYVYSSDIQDRIAELKAQLKEG